jgi:DNA invertase Pin-like site-specific DNA recombinase
MLIGYARVSTDDQHLDLQRDALEKAGCEKVYTDQQSGASTERLGLNAILEMARAGDTLVVWRLDRLGRSLKHLIHLVEKLDHQGIGLRSLQENIDTTTSGGRLVFHLFGALAEFERNLIRERTQAGLSASRWRKVCTASDLGSLTKSSDCLTTSVSGSGIRQRAHHTK